MRVSLHCGFSVALAMAATSSFAQATPTPVSVGFFRPSSSAVIGHSSAPQLEEGFFRPVAEVAFTPSPVAPPAQSAPPSPSATPAAVQQPQDAAPPSAAEIERREYQRVMQKRQEDRMTKELERQNQLNRGNTPAPPPPG